MDTKITIIRFTTVACTGFYQGGRANLENWKGTEGEGRLTQFRGAVYTPYPHALPMINY